jgi:hypothetical protein
MTGQTVNKGTDMPKTDSRNNPTERQAYIITGPTSRIGRATAFERSMKLRNLCLAASLSIPISVGYSQSTDHKYPGLALQGPDHYSFTVGDVKITRIVPLGPVLELQRPHRRRTSEILGPITG